MFKEREREQWSLYRTTREIRNMRERERKDDLSWIFYIHKETKF